MRIIVAVFSGLIIIGGFFACAANPVVGLLTIIVGLLLFGVNEITFILNKNHENLKDMLEHIFKQLQK